MAERRSAQTRDRGVHTRWAWLGIVLLSTSVLAASIAAGGLVAALALFVAIVGMFFFVRWAAGADARFVLATVGFAFALRTLIASIFDIALTQYGRGGALYLDDAAYLGIATQLAESWRSERAPMDIDPTQGGNYVKAAAALFFVFGPNAILLKLMNTACGVLAGVLVYRTMVNLRLPGPRIGLLLTLFFPSLVLWSALALKDAYVLVFALAPVWLMSEFTRTRRFLPWYPLVVISLMAIENVRVYVFVILLVAWPLATPLLIGRTGWVKPTAVAAALTALLLATTPALTYLNPNLVTASTYIRRAMALGARSGFVEPLPVVRANPGDRFVITTPGRTPVPSELVRTIEVRPGDDLVLDGSSRGNQRDPEAILVRPGDVIVIARAPTGTPQPPSIPQLTRTPAPLAVSSAGRNIVGGPPPAHAPMEASEDGLTARDGMFDAMRHLPVGVFHLIAAPVPLSSVSPIDIATIPEMLLWYMCQLLALWGLATLIRQRRFEFAYGVMVLAGIGLTLSLFEGNTGTLLRHRAMIIPFVVTLAAVGTADLLTRFRRPIALGLRPPADVGQG